MKNGIAIIAATVALSLAQGSYADGYYATKKDAKAGKLTPGPAPTASVGNAPTAGGDACPGTSLPVGGGFPYSDTGTTIGANNTVNTLPSGCSTYTQVAGLDVIYTMRTTSATNGLTFTLTPTGTTGYDPAIYLLNSCPSGTANTITTGCIKGADVAVNDIAETFTVTNIATATTYYFFVDSFYTTAPKTAGPYSLSITSTGGVVPVELMNFKVE